MEIQNTEICRRVGSILNDVSRKLRGKNTEELFRAIRERLREAMMQMRPSSDSQHDIIVRGIIVDELRDEERAQRRQDASNPDDVLSRIVVSVEAAWQLETTTSRIAAIMNADRWKKRPKNKG